VLVLVLIVFSGLSLLALGLCHRTRLELRMARMRGDDLRAFYLALGGVNRAVSALRKDLAEREDEVVHFGQPWHLATSAAAEGFFVDLDDTWRTASSLFYATTDEEGRLNIRTSSPAGWLALPGMDEAAIHAILDWEDEDDTPEPQGAETADHYMRQPYPYRAKNAPIGSVWELARLAGIDRRRLLGEDANGNGALDVNEDDGAASWPPDNMDGSLDHGLIDHFTVCGDGKVNLNTANRAVLSALPGVEPADAEEVVSFRAGPDRLTFTADDRYFASPDDVAKVSNLSPTAQELLAEYGTCTSRHFRVVSQASVRQDGPLVSLWALVSRTDGEVQVVFLRRL